MSLIDDCNELPSMENWLNSAVADWSEQHGIIESTAAATSFYETSSTPSAISLFGSKGAVTHPFLKLDALEICKENPDHALLVRTAEERVSEQRNNSSLLDRTPSLDEYLEADSPRGPLSPSALQLGKSSRPLQGNKRPLDDWIPVWDQRKLAKQQQQNEYAAPGFVAMAATAPTFQVPVTPASIAAAAAAPPTILFPAPLTLPNVPSMEEIAQTRPKRRNVKISKDPTSVAARHRRERISDRVRVLQHFVPGGTKMDTASMLDEAIHYVKFLQQQLQMLERLGNSYDPRFMTQEDPVMMPLEVGNSVRPFDLNRACFQTFPSTSMAQQPQQSSLATWHNTKTTSPFCSQGNFPDSAQEQFCH